MFTRRVALFLLGIWVGCCLFVDALALQRNRVAGQILDNPTEQARININKAGPEVAGQLLRHLSGEEIRSWLNGWEQAQGVIALGMVVLLVFTEHRKPIAIGMCGAMALLTFMQHFMITPEWTYVGRELDFLGDKASFSIATRNWTLTQLYGASEIVKLLTGGALASYFFAMEAAVKRRKVRAKTEEDSFDFPVKPA